MAKDYSNYLSILYYQSNYVKKIWHFINVPIAIKSFTGKAVNRKIFAIFVEIAHLNQCKAYLFFVVESAV